MRLAEIQASNRIDHRPKQVHSANYKTVPCTWFHSPNGCLRGDQCSFIHDLNYPGRKTPNFDKYVRPIHALSKNPSVNLANILNYKESLTQDEPTSSNSTMQAMQSMQPVANLAMGRGILTPGMGQVGSSNQSIGNSGYQPMQKNERGGQRENNGYYSGASQGQQGMMQGLGGMMGSSAMEAGMYNAMFAHEMMNGKLLFPIQLSSFWKRTRRSNE